MVIYDANNGSRQARKELVENFESRGVHVIWLESMCDREDIITANIRSVKLSSPDVSLRVEAKGGHRLLTIVCSALLPSIAHGTLKKLSKTTGSESRCKRQTMKRSPMKTGRLSRS